MIRSPEHLTEATFEAWKGERKNWEELARRISGEAGYSGVEIEAFGGSTNLVLALGPLAILKIFPPFFHDQFVSERAALEHIYGKLSVPIPKIISVGDLHGWSWILMTRLLGDVGSAVWPGLTLPEKAVILHDVGRVIAEVHAVPLGKLENIASSWPDFIASQARDCVSRHRQQGLPERFINDLAKIASDAIDVIPMAKPHVILTGDWIPQKFLLSVQAGQWRLAALIDFGDVRTGWHEYDFLAPSALMCEGHPQLVKSLFDGYGTDTHSSENDMRRRLLTLLALHQESDFQLIMIPRWEDRVSNRALK